MPSPESPASPAAADALPRRLTTIFCADVQGYSALVEADEVGTVARLKRYRAELIEEIERHHGRVVNTWGDGLLAEFASPVQAVFAAVTAQRRLAARNAAQRAETPDLPAMRFRIGINLGDVMVDGGDLYGDGVNIAARLESLAEPGGICIAGSVFEQVRKKLDFGFDFIGPREIKNIAEPVPAYRILLEGAASPHPAAPPAPAPAPAPALEAAAEAEAIRKWRRHACRLGILAGFFLILNLVTSPTRLWFFWPVLGFGLLLALRYPFGTDPRRLWPPWRND